MKKTMILVLAVSTVVMAQQTAPSPPPPTDIAGFDNGADPDEPGRPVARLSVASGDVSVKRGDATEWVAGALNAPIMEADTLSISRQAAGEVQFDNAHFARMAGDTEMRVVQIDGGLHRVQLSRGLVTWRVLRETGTAAEIATPVVAVRPVGLSAVRVEVAPDSTTRVTVRHGEAEVQTARGSERLHEGSLMIVRPAQGEAEFQITSAAGLDRWDTWSDQRDAYLLRAASPKYVSSDIYGAEDLDPYGRWTNDPAYGDVWVPNVPATWAPYRDGRWVWQDYYGWTWVDYQPWGWAPFHYGSWYYRTGFGWSWFPGARTARYYWRPAMVGFFGYGGGYGGGGFGIGIGFGNVGWVPLAPYERYRPWYGRGGYGGGRNLVVNNINITNVYRNTRIGNGATGISSRDFERGNYRNRQGVDPGQLQQASLVRGAGMTPTNDHLRFSDRSYVGSGPRSDFGKRTFFGDNRNGGERTGGSAVRTPFSEQQAAVRSRLGAFSGDRQGGNAQGGDFRNMRGNSGGVGFRGDQGTVRPNEGASQGWRQFGSPSEGGERQAFQGRSFQGQGASGQGSAGQTNDGNAYRGGGQGTVRQDGAGVRPDSSWGGRRFGGNGGTVDMNPPVVRQRESPDAGRRFGGDSGGYVPQRQQSGFGREAGPQYRQSPEIQAPRGNSGGFRGVSPGQRGNSGGGFSGGGAGGNGGGAPRNAGPQGGMGGNRRGR